MVFLRCMGKRTYNNRLKKISLGDVFGEIDTHSDTAEKPRFNKLLLLRNMALSNQ